MRSSILISHDLAVVGQVTDTGLVMQRGKIIERGDRADILDHRRPGPDFA